MSSCYACAMQCPVLSWRIVLSAYALAMLSDTGLAYDAMLSCYAMSGTGLSSYAFATRCPVLTYAMLRLCYALSSTDVRYAATRDDLSSLILLASLGEPTGVIRDVRYWASVWRHSLLCDARYWHNCTAIWYGGTASPVSVVLCGTVQSVLRLGMVVRTEVRHELQRQKRFGYAHAHTRGHTRGHTRVHVSYAMSGTDIGYAATRRTHSTSLKVQTGSILRACCAMSGTEIAYGGSALRACWYAHVRSGTDMAYGAMRCPRMVVGAGMPGKRQPQDSVIYYCIPRHIVTTARGEIASNPGENAAISAKTDLISGGGSLVFREIRLDLERLENKQYGCIEGGGGIPRAFVQSSALRHGIGLLLHTC
eukprot:2857624-Rhodomonas_salina.2